MSYRKIILILFLGIFLSAERSAYAQVTTLTFNYTGAMQTWTVPACVGQVTIDCYGAQGVPKPNENHPGFGGEARGVASVATGQVLNIFVGGQTGWNGGGIGENAANGGDASDVRLGGVAVANRIIVAGGGGGSAGDSWGCLSGVNGNGGGGTPVGTNFVGGGGGLGYGGCGLNGAAAGGAGYNGGNCHGGGGGGGGMTSGGGGATAACGPYTSSNGVLGAGGAAFLAPFCASEGAGGGGGGYYGGGGACGYNCGAGEGGGGSSWTGTLANPFFNQGVWTGNGKIVLSFTNDSVGSVQPNIITNIVCSGNATASASIFVNHAPAGAAFTYTWSPNVSSRDTATGLFAGIYSVTVSGCGSASTTVTITQPGFFASNPTINQIQCNGGKGSIYAGAIGGTSPYTYLFSPGGNVPFITNLSVGSYSLNVIDNKGCATSQLISITQPNPLVVAARSTDSVVCNGQSNGAATSAVTGGSYPYTYLWSPTGGNGASASGLTAGTYFVNVTDNNGCKSFTTVNVIQPNALNVLVYPPLLNLACNGDNNGVLGSGVNGGTRPYSYRWSGNLGTDSNATGLAAGTYTLTVTDAHHCVTTVTSTVTQPSPLVIAIDSTFNHGYCSGTAWVTLNGGVQPYTYLWSNGSNTYYQNGLCDGLFCCTVTDANGCVHNICTHISSDLGVDNVAGSDAKVTVYPNPNNGLFTIQSTAEGQSTVEVYNVLGAKVYSGMLSANKGSDNTINMSNQPNGVYLYRVISSTNGSLIGEGKVVLTK